MQVYVSQSGTLGDEPAVGVRDDGGLWLTLSWRHSSREVLAELSRVARALCGDGAPRFVECPGVVALGFGPVVLRERDGSRPVAFVDMGCPRGEVCDALSRVLTRSAGALAEHSGGVLRA